MDTIAHAARASRAAAALALALGATACATDAPSPSAPAAPAAARAPFTIRLTAPGDDAGLLVALRGAAVDSVRAEGGQALLLAGAADEALVAVTAADGARLDAVTVSVWTRDGVAPAATLREVAARGTLAERALAGYAVTVVR